MKANPKIKAKIKNYFAKRPEVAVVYLYGSFAKGEAKRSSDIDLGLILAKKENKPFHLPQVILADQLSEILGKRVEIQDLEACRIDFAHRVLSEGELLYSQDEEKRIKFEERVLKTFFDLKPSFEEYYHYLSQIAKKGELGARYL